MVLTEEEKKEYLINYQPTPRFSPVAELIVLFASGLCGAVLLTKLNDLGYTHIDLDYVQNMLFFVILVFVVMQLIEYALDKRHKK
jgi:hypothetical protein